MSNQAKKLCLAAIDDLKEWIDTAPLDIKVGDVAARSGWCRGYLCRCFVEATGVRLGTYLRERRLAASLHMLVSERKNGVETADLCGYATYDGFREAFARKYGTTPGRYVKQLKYQEAA